MDYLHRALRSIALLQLLSMVLQPRKLLRLTLKFVPEHKIEIGVVCSILLLILSQIAPDYVRVAVYETVSGWAITTASTLPDMLLDGVVLYGVTYFINWIRDELKKALTPNGPEATA